MTPCAVLRAANDSGPRKPSWIRHIVIHSTEGSPSAFPKQPSARGVADYFSKPATRASTQLVIDDTRCYRCVPDLVIPWGAPGVNRSGLHIEHCGWSRWTLEQWRAHRPMLERSAEHAALWCWTFRIPRRWLTVEQLKAGAAGFCTHAVASAAFTPGGHHDPGPGFPAPLYMQLVRNAYRQLEAERGSR